MKPYLAKKLRCNGYPSCSCETIEVCVDKLNNTFNNDLICPFCKDDGFDRIGLKLHLLPGLFSDPCEAFENLSIKE